MPDSWSDGRPIQKYAYLDHDTDIVNLAPPVLNQWYEVFHAYDVRLLWCLLYQTNGEAAAKNIEIRWTIDGTVYFNVSALTSGTGYYVYRDYTENFGGTVGLVTTANIVNAAYYVDKRGQDFKVEVRITSALGSAQAFSCRCVRETLEVT